MRRIMMTLGSTVVVLGSSLIASGQDKSPQAPAQAPSKQAPLQAPMQAPSKQAPLQAPMQAPSKQAPLQAPLQAPSKQAPMQAPMQKPMQAPTQAPIKGGYPSASVESVPVTQTYATYTPSRRGLFGRR